MQSLLQEKEHALVLGDTCQRAPEAQQRRRTLARRHGEVNLAPRYQACKIVAGSVKDINETVSHSTNIVPDPLILTIKDKLENGLKTMPVGADRPAKEPRRFIISSGKVPVW